ncbi:MAG TPA: type II toxin-antitoxin system RelE/ParE family toxin [Streptosporangiaceae bacterium]
MVYRIEWRPRARKAFLALDKPIRQRVAGVVDKLAADPRPAGVKALTGMPGVFRIRVAESYRVLYTIDDTVLLVLVVDVGHRREIYR